MEPPKAEMTLADLPIGARLLIRAKTEWRFAAISRKSEERITLSVASPKGRNYRIARPPESPLAGERGIQFLVSEFSEPWRENLSRIERRW